jgi:D-alanyl-D-alanine carboxypeptidase/D-alanyl-D-alanine-endopeptidase (penicillin-binding protein 4)
MPTLKPVRYRLFTIFLLSLFSSFFITSAYSSPEESLITSGGYMIVSPSGAINAAYRAETTFTPASIFKIATALQALETLGPDYRFPTYFYITPGIDLYIVGTGNPLLISEDIDSIVISLQERGIRQLRHIFIDNSRYELSHQTINDPISKNPYDTALSATGVNFNTMQLWVKKDTKIVSGEPQTPTLPLMEKIGQGLEPGVHRINLGQDPADLVNYAGQLFKAGFEYRDIKVTGQIAPRKTPAFAGLFFTHYSTELQKIIPLMLLYSNNFMANQIYLNCGMKQYGTPATWPKAAQALELFLDSNHLIKGDITIRDGAGLSPENKITCTTMIAILQKFRPYIDMLPLKKENFPIKSGTMTGVYSYAGFLGKDKDAQAIVLILNQVQNNRDALFDKLEREFSQSPAPKQAQHMDQLSNSRTTTDSR